jgi:hypothetical protein
LVVFILSDISVLSSGMCCFWSETEYHPCIVLLYRMCICPSPTWAISLSLSLSPFSYWGLNSRLHVC